MIDVKDASTGPHCASHKLTRT